MAAGLTAARGRKEAARRRASVRGGQGGRRARWEGAATAIVIDSGEGMADGSAAACGRKEAGRRRASTLGGQARRQPRLRAGMGASLAAASGWEEVGTRASAAQGRGVGVGRRRPGSDRVGIPPVTRDWPDISKQWLFAFGAQLNPEDGSFMMALEVEDVI
ncbi:hypothetical protein C2845_PM06G23930 [Panicum miliaceum]|uniref:Uncharacterized protein n=1 Tax=Panicum miliaceum TaxID=4540 RepID=A0A3L6R9K7_PANMI|nr:hypothetical protein C2845_PM06G23930 [Panicum miliaceum]